jgi:hypothetical protein
MIIDLLISSFMSLNFLRFWINHLIYSEIRRIAFSFLSSLRREVQEREFTESNIRSEPVPQLREKNTGEMCSRLELILIIVPENPVFNP